MSYVFDSGTGPSLYEQVRATEFGSWFLDPTSASGVSPGGEIALGLLALGVGALLLWVAFGLIRRLPRWVVIGGAVLFAPRVWMFIDARFLGGGGLGSLAERLGLPGRSELREATSTKGPPSKGEGAAEAVREWAEYVFASSEGVFGASPAGVALLFAALALAIYYAVGTAVYVLRMYFPLAYASVSRRYASARRAAGGYAWPRMAQAPEVPTPFGFDEELIKRQRSDPDHPRPEDPPWGLHGPPERGRRRKWIREQIIFDGAEEHLLENVVGELEADRRDRARVKWWVEGVQRCGRDALGGVPLEKYKKRFE
jgi:hypothetical protein